VSAHVLLTEGAALGVVSFCFNERFTEARYCQPEIAVAGIIVGQLIGRITHTVMVSELSP
jgi:hypothetical protein